MDIVLVTADSVRADHCGWLSGEGEQSGPTTGPSITPTLTALADESVTYTSAIAPGPRTLSSVPVSHTGVPFACNNFGTDEYDERAARIRSHVERFETLAETLQDAGYTTLAFTANPWTSTNTGFDVGFDEFREVGRSGGEIWSRFQGTVADKPARLFDRWVHNDTWFCRWRTFYDDLLERIGTTEGPVFAWVFLLEPHNPYLLPRSDRHESSTLGMYSAVLRANSFLGQVDGRTAVDTSINEETLARLQRAYRDTIRSVDTFVDRLLSDLSDDVTLIFHSDHGEAFGEHGTYGHTPTLYEENIHVPLLVYGTDRDDTVESPVSTAEVASIVRACARDDDLRPEAYTTDVAAARTEADDAIALRSDRWKYLRMGDRESLYDLREDPMEREDVSTERPDVLAGFREKRAEYESELPDSASNRDAEDDDEVKEHLRSLGYL